MEGLKVRPVRRRLRYRFRRARGHQCVSVIVDAGSAFTCLILFPRFARNYLRCRNNGRGKQVCAMTEPRVIADHACSSHSAFPK